MGEWARGSAPKELIELSRRYYGDGPLPIDVLREKETKKPPQEMFEELQLRLGPLGGGLSIKIVVEITGIYYGFPYPQIISAQRHAKLAFARHVAFYLCRELPCGHFGAAPSFPQIGMGLGGRDHSTVMHGIRKIQTMLDSGNDKLAADLGILRGLIQAYDKSVRHLSESVAAE